MKRFKNKKTFVFDLDNTLVKTNRANNESYKEAIRIVTGYVLPVYTRKRFTRSDLRNYLPELSNDDFLRIVEKKENIFGDFIETTRLNRNLFTILRALHENGNKTILLTNCHKKRAIQLCMYYGLNLYFNEMYYYEDYQNSKYEFLFNRGYDSGSIILFENEKKSTKEALKCGLDKRKIIKVKF